MTDVYHKLKKTRLTEDSVQKTLVSLALPTMGGLFAMFAFNLADTYFVGKLGTNEIAALSYTFPVVITIIYITLGLSTGTTSLIARDIGKENYQQVRENTTNAIILAIFAVACLQAVGLMTIKPLFTLLGAQKELIPLINDYMSIWYIGISFLVVPIVGNGAIRGSGDSTSPSIIMIIASIANFILDPIFIFGFGMIPAFGIKGAAIATLLARAISFFISLYILTIKKNLILLSIPSFKNLINSWKKILHVGIPTALTNIAIPFASGIIVMFLSSYGKEAVAAYGIVSRIETFFLMAVISFSVSMAPFVGQNWEAGHKTRVCQAIHIGFKFSFIWGAVISLILIPFATQIVSLFNNNDIIIEYGKLYIYIVSLTYLYEGIRLNTSSIFNGLARPLNASLIVIIRVFMFYIPLAYLGSVFFQVPGIFLGIAMANLFTGYIAYRLSKKVCKEI